MIGLRVLLAAGLLAAMAAGASAASGDDYWTGPYLGPTYGRGTGTASYLFATNGWYNVAPGDSFDQDLFGKPMGGAIGYNWRSGAFVYGIEAFIHSHGVAAESTCLALFPAPLPGTVCGDVSPFAADHEFDFKGHWFTGLNVRAGLAHGRWLGYVQGGPVLGHLVSRVDDLTNGYYITPWKAPASVIGVTGEVGLQFALGRRVSIGVGYRGTYLRPLLVSTESIDDATGLPAGPATATDHTIQFTSRAVVARLIYRFGQGKPKRQNITPFDWSGAYWGLYAGALWQIGLQAGYDFVFGGPFLFGANAQASVNVCCGIAYEADLNARLGYIWRDDILFYAEAGVAAHTGTFFGVFGGAYYSVGGGVEIAFTPRMTAFMEAKMGGNLALGFVDTNFQGGLNFRLSPR